MPRLFRAVLPVGDLAEARRFYGFLLGDDGHEIAPGWLSLGFDGAMLTCHLVEAVEPHPEPVCIAVDEPLVQVHYRAQSLRPPQVDAEPRTLPTGEYGFLVLDPWGNVLWIVDARSVPWHLQQARTASAPSAPVGADDGQLSLQRDFVGAVKGGDLQTVRDLLEVDPDLAHANDAAGVSPLMHAAYKQHQDVAEVLLAKYEDLNLWEAAAFGREARLRFLLDRGFKPTVYSPDGFTPLGLACFFGHPKCVKLLLAKGADANAPSRNDMQVRPLHSAVARVPDEQAALSVRILLAAGADPNATQHGGYTALHQAADRGLRAVTTLLLAAGADPLARAANRRTPMDHARTKGHKRVLALLKSLKQRR